MASGGSVAQLGDINAGNFRASQANMTQMLQLLATEQARRRQFQFQQQQANRGAAMDDASMQMARDQNFARTLDADRRFALDKERVALDRDYFNRGAPPIPAQIAADSRTNSDLFRIAQQEAEEGTFDPNAYKSLTPEQIAALSRRNSTVQNINRDVSAARSRMGQLRNYVSLSTDAMKTAPVEPTAGKEMQSTFGKAASFVSPPLALLNAAGYFDLPSPSTPTRQSIGRDIQDWTQEQQAIQGRLDAYQRGEPWTATGGGYFAPTTTTTNAPVVKPLTQDVAIQFLQQANGNKDVARRLAREAGYSF